MAVPQAEIEFAGEDGLALRRLAAFTSATPVGAPALLVEITRLKATSSRKIQTALLSLDACRLLWGQDTPLVEMMASVG